MKKIKCKCMYNSAWWVSNVTIILIQNIIIYMYVITSRCCVYLTFSMNVAMLKEPSEGCQSCQVCLLAKLSVKWQTIMIHNEALTIYKLTIVTTIFQVVAKETQSLFSNQLHKMILQMVNKKVQDEQAWLFSRYYD